MTDQFEPTIIGFTCNWCSYRAADLAGTSRIKYPPNVRLIRLMCSGRLDPTFVFKALASGADGVMITGCHPGECHYLEQNYKALRRFHLMRRTLRGAGARADTCTVGMGFSCRGGQVRQRGCILCRRDPLVGSTALGPKYRNGKAPIAHRTKQT